MSAAIAIGNGQIAAAIDRHGAELVSLTDAQGRQYMTDGDPAWWTGRAPLLFPIVGELADGHYRLEDARYTMHRHGFARRSDFAVVEHGPTGARLVLEDSAATRACYPFAFALELGFALAGWTLAVEATVRNPGTAPLPFAFGFHPGFAWPLPGGGAKDAHRIVFDRPQPQDIRRLDADGLVADSEPTPVAGDTLALRPELFERDALVWDTLTSTRVRYEGEHGAALEVAFDDTRYFGIWQKPGAPYICIEPWAGIADHAGFAGDFHAKAGVTVLPPGAAWRFAMQITVHPAA